VANRTRSGRFARREIAIASALADYAGIAIENARLYREAETERAKLHAILGQADEAILVINEEDRLLLCNAAARDALHLSPADLEGKRGPPLVETVVQVPAILDLLARGESADGAIHGEVSLEDGRIYIAHLTPVGGVGRVLMLQDVTHLKELDRLRSEFVTAVSHDMRTPLTSVQGYIDLLAKAGPINEKQGRFLDRMETSLKNITDLIDDLLNIRRIEAELDLEMEPCDLRSVIDEVVQRTRPYADQKDQELDWEKPSSPLRVHCNPRRMAQAVENLVTNAIKYSSSGGRVAVTAREDDGHVVVSVSDEGIGISSDEQLRIFDRFYRGKAEEVAGVPGTGLGLSIVKAVIDKHGGRVWVDSQPGAGSTFSFVLPALGNEG
jgi:two-component system NtrC family sensor kinase